MSIFANCPPSASIGDVPIAECLEDVGQIQKAVLSRVNSAVGTPNTVAAPSTLAAWTPKLAAADGTKVVQTPYFTEPTAEAGAAKTFGGGNQTLGGVPIIIGREPTPFTAKFLQTAQNSIAALKKFMGESNLGVYLIDEYGNILARRVESDAAEVYRPIPIKAFFVSDKTFGGFDNPDTNMVSWNFLPNWSDELAIITPAAGFNPLEDLVTPA